MIEKIKKSATFAFPAAVALIFPFAIHAQTLVPDDLSKTTDLVAVIQAIIRFILVAAFVLAFIFLIIGGIQYITAGGDPKAAASARDRITGAIVGLIIVVAAFAIVLILERVFGIRIVSGVVFPASQGQSGT